VYRTRGFYECWTRKEAFVKAIGLGLSHGLERFEVTFGPGVVPRIVRIDDLPATAEHWELHAFDLNPDYCGAVAVRARDSKLVIHSLERTGIADLAFETATMDGRKRELLARIL
jgi:4'-phosphopantetheinyl transferase